VVYVWRSTPRERALSFPCDAHLQEPDAVLFRAVSVAAPLSITFRWLCQLRIAPYSCDPLDNPRFYLGRPSPTVLTSGADRLERGQVFMTMFRLVDFTADAHITLLAHRFHTVFGEAAVTYRVSPDGTGSRIVVKLIGRHADRAIPRMLQTPIAWVDLFMMRRQLRKLKRLAERDARTFAELAGRPHQTTRAPSPPSP
jgi:hypothetical protein